MDRQRLRQVLTGGIDRLVTHRLISFISDEERDVLMACRAVAVTDDAFVDRILSQMGNYREADDAAGKTD